MERNEVSRHEISVYQSLSTGQWMTAMEVSKAADVAPRTARAHLLKLVGLGVVEQANVFPGHRYRLSAHAAQRNQGYTDRLTRAASALGMTEEAG